MVAPTKKRKKLNPIKEVVKADAIPATQAII